MSREVRKVPKDWQHPKNEGGRYIPLFEGDPDFNKRDAEWMEEYLKWQEGFCLDSSQAGRVWKEVDPEYRHQRYSDYSGGRPSPDDYMPVWCPKEATHYMMYEDTSEGTPISPVFETPEELARWLSDTGASAFGNQTASYEGWLRVCQGGYAPSIVVTSAGLISGVDGIEDHT